MAKRGIVFPRAGLIVGALLASALSAGASPGSGDCPGSPSPTFESELRRGDCLAKKDNPDLAIKAYLNALKLRPQGSRELYYKLGMAFVDVNEWEPALRALTEASRMGTVDADLHYWLGVAREFLEDYEGALVEFRDAIKLDPRHGPAHRNIGFVRMQQNRLEEAVPELKVALRINSKDWKATLNLGAAYADIYDAITKELKDLSFPVPGESVERRLASDRRKEELNKKLKQFDYRRESLALLREATRLNPDSSETWYNLGTILMGMKSPEAIESLQRAATLAPNSPAIFTNLSAALSDAHRYREALDAAERVRSLTEGRDPATILNIARLEYKLGYYPLCKEHLLAVLRMDPKSAEAHMWLAMVYKRLRKPELSTKHLEAAQTLEPDNAAWFASGVREEDPDKPPPKPPPLERPAWSTGAGAATPPPERCALHFGVRLDGRNAVEIVPPEDWCGFFDGQMKMVLRPRKPTPATEKLDVVVSIGQLRGGRAGFDELVKKELEALSEGGSVKPCGPVPLSQGGSAQSWCVVSGDRKRNSLALYRPEEDFAVVRLVVSSPGVTTTREAQRVFEKLAASYKTTH